MGQSRVLTHGISGGTGIEETIAVVAVVAAVASAATAAYGSYKAGQTSKAVGEYNAEISEEQARQSRQAAAYEAQRERDKARRILASQQAAYGAAGVTQEGSPLLVMADTAQQLEMDALAIQYGGAARGAAAEAEAKLQRFKGSQAQMAGMIGAGSSLLSGVAGAAGGAYNYFRPSRVPKVGTSTVYGPTDYGLNPA